MPKLKNQPPKICRIRSNNAAIVYVNGRTIYLGQWGTEKALQEYARFLTEWTNAEIKETIRAEKRPPTVAKLVAEFLNRLRSVIRSPDAFASNRQKQDDRAARFVTAKRWKNDLGILPRRFHRNALIGKPTLFDSVVKFNRITDFREVGFECLVMP